MMCLGATAVLHKSFYVTYIFLLPCHNDVGWEHPEEWVVETQRGFLELAKRVLPPSLPLLFLCYAAATSKVWITSRQLESFSNSIAFATQDFRYILSETWLRFFGQSFPAPQLYSLKILSYRSSVLIYYQARKKTFTNHTSNNTHSSFL